MERSRSRPFPRAVEQLVAWVAQRRRETCVLAIDGYSAAGKSTFAAELGRRTRAPVVRGDDFYRVMAEAERTRLEPAEAVQLYYDWQRLRDEVLLPVRNAVRAEYRPYDWDTGRLASRVVEVSSAVVIVEGVFVSRPELQPFLDRSILVETPATIRRSRQLQRADASAEWLERWDAAERHFFGHVRPPHTFHIIVDGR